MKFDVYIIIIVYTTDYTSSVLVATSTSETSLFQDYTVTTSTVKNYIAP